MNAYIVMIVNDDDEHANVNNELRKRKNRKEQKESNQMSVLYPYAWEC